MATVSRPHATTVTKYLSTRNVSYYCLSDIETGLVSFVMSYHLLHKQYAHVALVQLVYFLSATTGGKTATRRHDSAISGILHFISASDDSRRLVGCILSATK